ncbi:hypothetical protein HMPREF9372_0945 [Sporosarcina newyorkensis 2681]|uniref:Uncharacterized protein n=1 Tax=Sporosarcina newyorkensis 2681 TaxID=1027292 RepID=F9DQ65_9BACL|nr:hypothetical protein [Sporosarcina newyorkensis]EGQ27062.1 hypothetical protein HMPREF9372_0945 [Sporosarcina newyorkensis 2681]
MVEKPLNKVLDNIEKRDSLGRDNLKTLPDELLANDQRMALASDNKPLKILSTDEELMRFVEKMQKFYDRTTQEHVNYMRARDYEGSVEERTWYNIARQLKRNNVLQDLQV